MAGPAPLCLLLICFVLMAGVTQGLPWLDAFDRPRYSEYQSPSSSSLSRTIDKVGKLLDGRRGTSIIDKIYSAVQPKRDRRGYNYPENDGFFGFGRDNFSPEFVRRGTSSRLGDMFNFLSDSSRSFSSSFSRDPVRAIVGLVDIGSNMFTSP